MPINGFFHYVHVSYQIVYFDYEIPKCESDERLENQNWYHTHVVALEVSLTPVVLINIQAFKVVVW